MIVMMVCVDNVIVLEELKHDFYEVRSSVFWSSATVTDLTHLVVVLSFKNKSLLCLS